MGIIDETAYAFTEACHDLGREVGGQEIVELVKRHCQISVGTALASGWVPGIGGTAAMLAAAANVWTMYFRINQMVGIQLGEDTLKTIATGVGTNLAASFVGGIAASTVMSLIPGLGSMGAAATSGAIAYSMTLASGVVYMKIMTNLMKAGVDPSQVDEDDLESMAKAAAKKINIDAIKNEGRAGYNASNPA